MERVRLYAFTGAGPGSVVLSGPASFYRREVLLYRRKDICFSLVLLVHRRFSGTMQRHRGSTSPLRINVSMQDMEAEVRVHS